MLGTEEDEVAARAGRRGGLMAGALEGVRVLDLTRLLPGGFCTLLLADMGADVLKVEDTGGGDYIRWMPPYYGGEEQQRDGHRVGLLPRAEPQQAVAAAEPEGRARARRAAAAGRGLRRRRGELPARRDGPPRRRLRGAAGAQPARDLLPDLRLRAGRPADGALRARHQLPRAQRPARPDRPPRRPADPVRRPDRRPRRRRPDGGGRHPGGAARARALGRGPGGRHLDDRRRAVVARDGGGALLRRAEGAAARRARAGRRDRLLLPVRDEGRRSGSRWARSSRSSGRTGATGSAAPT